MNKIEHRLRLIELTQQKIPVDPYITEVIDWLTDELRRTLDDKKVLCSALQALARDKWCGSIKAPASGGLSIADMAKEALDRCLDR